MQTLPLLLLGLLLLSGCQEADALPPSRASVSLSSATPAAVGTAAVGTGTSAARSDHVHALPNVVAAGSCTTCDLTYDAQGRITVAANGSAGGFDAAVRGSVPTSGNTPTALWTYTPTDGKAVVITAATVGRKTDGTLAAGYVRMGAFRRAGGTTTQIGATAAPLTVEDDAVWDSGFDVSGADIRALVTGDMAVNIDWDGTAQITIAP